MLVRIDLETPSIEMDLDTFVDLVRRGIVRPSSLIHDRVLSMGEWWSADNLRLFHRNTNWEHPIGSHLAEQFAREEEKERQNRRRFEEIEKLPRAQPIAYRLPGLEDIAGPADIIAVCRLIIYGSWLGQRVATVVVRKQALDLEILPVTVDYSSLEPVPNECWSEPRRAVLPMAQTPQCFREFESFLALAQSAKSSSTLLCDGTSYRHLVWYGSVRIDTRWDGPGVVFVNGWDNTPPVIRPDPAWTIVLAYNECMTRGGIAMWGVPGEL